MTTEPEQTFSDLIAFGRRSLAWVRIYRRGPDEAIALALNPTDAPGGGVINDAEALLEILRGSFPNLSGPRLFLRFADDPRGPDWTEFLDTAEGPNFLSRPVAEVEDLVGEELLDPLDPTCAGVGGEFNPLLALVPPPEIPRNPIDELAVVAVAELPWAHNPSNCRWFERFQAVSDLYPPDENEEPAVGAQWYLSLSEAEIASCVYHRADWKRIAEVSVEVFEGLADGADLDEAAAAVHRKLGDSAERGWCKALFTDPIVCHPGQGTVTDGQHRSCGLRASGAALCVVAVRDGYLVEEPKVGDPRRRAAAEMASFWARRASI